MAYILEESAPPRKSVLTLVIFSILVVSGTIHFSSKWHALLGWNTFVNGLSYFILLIYAFMHIGIYVHSRLNSSATQSQLSMLRDYSKMLANPSKILLIPCFTILLFSADLLFYPESIVTTQSTTVVAVVCGKKATFGRTTNCYKVPGVGKLNLYHSQLKGSRAGDQKTLTLQFRKSAFLPGVQYIQTK